MEEERFMNDSPVEFPVKATCEECGLVQDSFLRHVVNQQGDNAVGIFLPFEETCRECGGQLRTVREQPVSLVCENCCETQVETTSVVYTKGKRFPVWGDIAIECKKCGEPFNLAQQEKADTLPNAVSEFQWEVKAEDISPDDSMQFDDIYSAVKTEGEFYDVPNNGEAIKRDKHIFVEYPAKNGSVYALYRLDEDERPIWKRMFKTIPYV